MDVRKIAKVKRGETSKMVKMTREKAFENPEKFLDTYWKMCIWEELAEMNTRAYPKEDSS